MRHFTSAEPSTAPQPAPARESTDTGRRRFLFTLGVGGAGAAAASANALPALAVTQVDPAAAVDKDAAYRETEHVRDYYRTTRI